MPRDVIADTFYWLALARPRDPWHAAVSQWAGTHPWITFVTQDEVLIEFLNALAGTGPVGRAYAATIVRDIRNDPHVVVLPQSRAEFDAALALYESRPDKGYSLTDCRSMLAARGRGILEI